MKVLSLNCHTTDLEAKKCYLFKFCSFVLFYKRPLYFSYCVKVNPRGNLWATGHFMGKKSVMDSTVLNPAFENEKNPSEVLKDIHKLLQVLKLAQETEK
uniref:Neuromedin Bb n=1 Tax=Oryzias latipes TaxID=8090 RepID=A0A3B3HB94_ORYLA